MSNDFPLSAEQALRRSTRRARALAILAAVIAIGGVALGAYSLYLGGHRRDEACLRDEREHKREVRGLRDLYTYFAGLSPKQARSDPVTQFALTQLPQARREARSDEAPEYCDEEGVGLPEPDPKLPPRQDFSYLVSPGQREAARARRREARARGQVPGRRGQVDPVAPPELEMGKGRGESPLERRPAPREGERGPEGREGEPGVPGPRGEAPAPSEPPPAEPAPPTADPAEPRFLRDVLEDVGDTVNDLLQALP